MGLSFRITEREPPRPGVYQIVCRDGVRFRNSANMEDLAATESLALFDEQFAVLRFETDVEGVSVLHPLAMENEAWLPLLARLVE